MRKYLLTACLSGAAVILSGAAAAQDKPVKPDNTRVNKQDRTGDSPTADDQKMNKADRELAQKVRRAIVRDKSLSTYAHNVKVIVQNGAITLKGPVHSDEEKRSVEAKAASVAGSASITNEITVKGDAADRTKTPKQ